MAISLAEPVDAKLDFLLAVDRLVTAADKVRLARDKLLEMARQPATDTPKDGSHEREAQP
jgi:hypothetical protein